MGHLGLQVPHVRNGAAALGAEHPNSPVHLNTWSFTFAVNSYRSVQEDLPPCANGTVKLKYGFVVVTIQTSWLCNQIHGSKKMH